MSIVDNKWKGNDLLLLSYNVANVRMNAHYDLPSSSFQAYIWFEELVYVR